MQSRRALLQIGRGDGARKAWRGVRRGAGTGEDWRVAEEEEFGAEGQWLGDRGERSDGKEKEGAGGAKS